MAIEERRSYALWQLAVACVASLIVGMIIGYSGKKTSSAAKGSGSHSLFTLPPVNSGAPGGSTTTMAGLAPGAQSTTTTSSPASSGSQVATVLLPATRGKGTTDLPSFATAGTFSFGWAYDCAENTAATGSFAVTVVPASATANAPAVRESGQSNQGVAHEPATTGTEHLHVDASSGCIWIVKVTGIAATGG